MDLAVLSQNQVSQGSDDYTPWSNEDIEKDFKIETISLALDRSSLKKVNKSLDEIFSCM